MDHRLRLKQKVLKNQKCQALLKSKTMPTFKKLPSVFNLFLIFYSLLLIPYFVWAAEKTPPELEGVGITEQLGAYINLDTSFVDQNGKNISLKNYFKGDVPVVLALVYYSCPSLCNLLLNGLKDTLSRLDWKVGEKFRIVTVSFDPEETYELAAKKRETYLQSLNLPANTDWHFLTGQEENIKRLTETIGFSYKYDKSQMQYAHSAAIYVLTPEGKISRYLFGIMFEPRDLKLSLLEASEGKVGNFVDRMIMFCYHYDPQGRKYSLYSIRLMRVAGYVTVLSLAVFLFFLSRRKRETKNRNQ
ncbi:MAG TPA: SCO family protein [Bdellovibrionota bacterium]|nr:SCO family protein [Bdellovibrionota bacterium]